VLPTAPTSTAPDPGCARCPLTHSEPNNQRRRGHWVQPVTWVPASICVREKPNGNSFCRAPVGAGQPNPPTTTQQETRPRSGPPSSWANQSPKMTTTAPFGAGNQASQQAVGCVPKTPDEVQGQAASGKRPAHNGGHGKREAARRQRRQAAAASVRRASGSGKRPAHNGGHGKREAARRQRRPRQRQRQAASGKTSAAQRRQAAESRQAARRQRLNGEGPAGGPALLRSSAKGNLWFSLAEWEGLCSRLGTPLSWRRGTWSGSEWVR
jgi:hypothetical protein